jgi:hypothetical protein
VHDRPAVHRPGRRLLVSRVCFLHCPVGRHRKLAVSGAVSAGPGSRAPDRSGALNPPPDPPPGGDVVAALAALLHARRRLPPHQRPDTGRRPGQVREGGWEHVIDKENE